MATLTQISAAGFAGTAPTPVEQVAINQYLIPDKLFNIMRWENLGMGSNIGNIQATVLTYDTPAEADFRSIGEEYEVDNNPPIPVTITLKQLGGSFNTDRVLERAFSQNPSALSNWTEQQIGQKINSIIRGFAKAFMTGDSSVNVKSFDGLKKFFDEKQSQVAPIFALPGGLSDSNALQVEQYFNEVMAKMNRPNAIITSRTKGKPFLQALEAFRHRGIVSIKVDSTEYDSFMGLPIVEIPDEFTPAAWADNGIWFVFARFHENDGVRCAVPMNSGTGLVLDIIRPRMAQDGGGNAVMVRNGAVELCCTPVLVDKFALAMGFIKETDAVPVTAVSISGSSTAAVGTASTYTATVTPADATHTGVTWSVTPGTGTAEIDGSGKLTPLTAGTVTVKATAANGVNATKQVTIS